MRRRFAAVTATLVLGAAALAGCTVARNTLGTSSSPCYRALPVAADAVHRRGSFVGVRLVSASELTKLNHLRTVIEARSSTPVKNICVVGYKGRFRPDQVAKPAGPVPDSGVGHFAVVVVTTPQNTLLATVVLAKEPLRFLHLA
ncbi:MAG TPA: hypothetical protein VMB72_07790 [Acidimicrobiales bacterium]|nr:hypothetical protein [Acidimicrobiales bacterium]